MHLSATFVIILLMFKTMFVTKFLLFSYLLAYIIIIKQVLIKVTLSCQRHCRGTAMYNSDVVFPEKYCGKFSGNFPQQKNIFSLFIYLTVFIFTYICWIYLTFNKQQWWRLWIKCMSHKNVNFMFLKVHLIVFLSYQTSKVTRQWQVNNIKYYLVTWWCIRYFDIWIL